MELFKLFGKIAIEGADKANSDISGVSANAQKSSSVIGKLGTAIQNAFKSKSIQEVDTSVEKLTSRMTSQQNKIDLLKKKYTDLYLTHGKNSKEAKECAAEIEKLSSELQDNKKSLEKAQSAADKFDKSLDDAAKTAEKSSSKIGKALKSVGTVASSAASKAGAALKSIGSAAVKVGKTVAVGLAAASVAIGGLVASSINAYADYEQLVGGVETLFGDSAKTVQKYAENAYKTAGLSANEYMETVTSFSASLLQSLGGDTQKAAEMADLAITDMSDNANKMGTDMSSIQNAYQGFAKQNYTMLDNLKLGYGGTQEEMQRLIDDANALNAAQGKLTNYSISSYADIVSAIHDVQTEMGITGTTAKEAASTVSGSIGSMKSAWKNLLTAISSEDLPVDEYVSKFVTSVSTVADNLIPRIKIALDGVVQLVKMLAPKIVSVLPELVATLLPAVLNAATSLIQAIATTLPMIVTTIVGCLPDIISAIVTVFDGIIASLPTLIEKIATALMTGLPILINGVVSLVNGVVTALPSIVAAVIDCLPTLVDSIVTGLINLTSAITDGIVSCLPDIISAIITVFGGIVEALPSLIDIICEALPTIVPLLIDGLVTMIVMLCNNFPTIIKPIIDHLPAIIISIVQALVSNLPALIDGVIALVLGIVEAIPEIIQGLVDALPTMIAMLVTSLLENLPRIIAGLIQAVFGIVKALPQILWSLIEAIVNTFVGLFKGIWDWVKGLFGGSKSSDSTPDVGGVGTEYYADGGVLDRATVFGVNGNNLMIGGEAGKEAVAPISTLQTYIADAVASQNAGIAEGLNRIAAMLNAILDSMGDDLKEQISSTTIQVDSRVLGRVVRGLV